MPQATVEGLSGGLDGFTADFESRSGCKELLSSAPGELPALSSRPSSRQRNPFNYFLHADCFPHSAVSSNIYHAIKPSFGAHRLLLLLDRSQHRRQRSASFYEDEQRV